MSEANWNELYVRRMSITVSVSFDAFVLDSDDYSPHVSLAERLQGEIADAIEMHATHLGDSEDGDALVAVIGGGSGDCVRVHLCSIQRSEDLAGADEIDEQIANTRAWL